MKKKIIKKYCFCEKILISIIQTVETCNNNTCKINYANGLLIRLFDNYWLWLLEAATR